MQLSVVAAVQKEKNREKRIKERDHLSPELPQRSKEACEKLGQHQKN